MTATTRTPASPEVEADGLLAQYRAVRATTDTLAAPLSAEDCLIQSMPDASPTKWHLAHTSWFFETFLLAAEVPDYRPASAAANFLFNSYYNAIGERIARDRRGLLSRPSMEEVRAYRREIDRRMGNLLAESAVEALIRIAPLVTLGLNHEQQHQELILTDIKHAFGSNPLLPAYRPAGPSPGGSRGPLEWFEGQEGITTIGHDGPGFAFDNERPRHRVLLQPREIAGRLATAGEYLEFIEAGGYERPEYWLSDGWAARKSRGWTAPLYWQAGVGSWTQFTLGGPRPLDQDEPVCHVSFYEADAFARWSHARLPTEAEWETFADTHPIEGNFLESGRFHPEAAECPPHEGGPAQLFGDVWEWTASPYVGYPGFHAAKGALGEYNGKFMCNQMVLRGGSCATPRSHVRASYRNFFPPDVRWQFSGIRLAR